MRERVIKKVMFDSTVKVFSRTQERCKGGSYWLVMIDHKHHVIEFENFGGSAPAAYAVMNFLLTDKDVREELRWYRDNYKRKYQFGFNARTGMSGSFDLKMLVAKVTHDWAFDYAKKECVVHWHVSCAGKMNQGIPDMFSCDLYEIINNIKANNDDNFWHFDLDTKKSSRWKRKSYKYMTLRR
jgi:hypothetical protein